MSEIHPTPPPPAPSGLQKGAGLSLDAMRFEVLFDAAPLGIALSQHGRYLRANQAFLKLFGHSQEEEILGRPLLDHIETPHKDLIRARNEVREQTGSGPMDYEAVGIRKDGSSFPMRVHVTSIQLEGGAGTLAFISDLSARKQIEDRLRESEETFRSYVEQSIDVIFTLDGQGAFTFVSPAWAAHFGYPASEVVGHPFAPFVHPEDAQPCREYLGRVLATGQAETSPPYRVRRADGTWLWFVANGARLTRPDGDPQFIGVGRDITESRQVEEALRASEEQLRVIFEASDAGIILVSPAGEIQFANRRMAELFGLPVQALIGTTYPDHLHPAEMQAGDERMRALIKGEIQSVSLERRYLRADGTDFWGHLAGRRLEHPDGSLRALVGIITDISLRREAEQQQHLLHTQLQQAQKMESLGSLAGGVAHDMNNVLGAILGLASAHVDTQPPGGPTQRAFGTIIKAAERGGTMLRSLLSFARQGADEVREIDLNAILREEVRLLERTTLARVHLCMDLAPDLKPIRGDVGALTNAFMNLCVNAVDAMNESGTLTLRTRNDGPDWIEAQVEDTGAGMTREVLERALDPFFTTKDVGKGTGLGLSIVYRIVQAHQGQIGIHSEPGQGTTVTLRFPAREARTEGKEPSGPHETSIAGPSLKVLLVDDDELIQTAMQSILELLGHQASVTSTGEEALAKIEAGLRPDVVVLDMNMPGLGGAGTLPRLRALLPVVPVLLATGRADQAAQNLLQAHPFVTLLSKPFGMKALQVHLEAIARSQDA